MWTRVGTLALASGRTVRPESDSSDGDPKCLENRRAQKFQSSIIPYRISKNQIMTRSNHLNRLPTCCSGKKVFAQNSLERLTLTTACKRYGFAAPGSTFLWLLESTGQRSPS